MAVLMSVIITTYIYVQQYCLFYIKTVVSGICKKSVKKWSHHNFGIYIEYIVQAPLYTYISKMLNNIAKVSLSYCIQKFIFYKHKIRQTFKHALLTTTLCVVVSFPASLKHVTVKTHIITKRKIYKTKNHTIYNKNVIQLGIYFIHYMYGCNIVQCIYIGEEKLSKSVNVWKSLRFLRELLMNEHFRNKLKAYRTMMKKKKERKTKYNKTKRSRNNKHKRKTSFLNAISCDEHKILLHFLYTYNGVVHRYGTKNKIIMKIWLC